MRPRIRTSLPKHLLRRARGISDSKSSTAEPDAEYVRRAYDRAIDWYKVAESKAQLLLTVNGLLVTVFIGLLTGRAVGPARMGVDTRIFILVSATAVVAAVACAAAALWSRHTDNIKQAFSRLHVDPADPTSYRPEVLWYFGHLARLNHEAAAEMISKADRPFEITALSYNLVNLSAVVLRKHRLVNLGWALTGPARHRTLRRCPVAGRSRRRDPLPEPGPLRVLDGTAPIDASSGDRVRHRFSRAGNRQINRVLHIMATVQLRNPTEGRAYFDRKKATGKTSMEAMRALKRRLSDVVYRQLINDATASTGTGPGGHRGTSTNSSVTSLHPHAGSSEKPLPEPADNKLRTPIRAS